MNSDQHLANKKCVPCEVGGLPLPEKDADNLLVQVPEWSKKENKIVRTFTFKNFVDALAFVNKVGTIAEEEGHHPDIFINYNKVTFELTTHAVGGLTENDFILAAKINTLG